MVKQALLLALLVLPVAWAAVTVGGEVSAQIGITPIDGGSSGTDMNVTPPPDVKVIADKEFRVVSIRREGTTVSIDAVAELPTPCYKLRGPFQEVKAKEPYTVEVKYILVPPPTGTFCPQVVTQTKLLIKVRAPPVGKVVIYLKMERGVHIPPGEGTELPERNRGFTLQPVVKNRAGVEYKVEAKQDKLQIELAGCYKVKTEPLRCINCYRVYVEPSEGCEDSRTEVELELTANMRPIIEIVKVGEKASKEEASAEEIEKRLTSLCEEMVKRVSAHDPELAKEIELRCRERLFWGLKAREKICEFIKEHNEDVYKVVCEVPRRVIIGTKIKSILTSEESVEKLKKRIKELEEEIKKYRREIQQLRLKIQELRRKLYITTKGVYIENIKEPLQLPKIEVELKVKNKPVVVKKEGNTISIEVNAGKRIQARVKVPLVVEKNEVKVLGRALRVLPDEVVEKIKKRVADVVSNVELKTENNRPVYKVRAKMRGRLFFILPVEVPVEAEIDAESGGTIAIRRPWWAFFVFR